MYLILILIPPTHYGLVELVFFFNKISVKYNYLQKSLNKIYPLYDGEWDDNLKRSFFLNKYAFWLNYRKLSFFLNDEFSNILKRPVNINLIDAFTNISGKGFRQIKHLFYSIKSNKKIFFKNYWEIAIFKDFSVWLVLSIYYKTVSLILNIIVREITDRKKHWPFLRRLKSVIKWLHVDKTFFRGLTIGFFGKIQGKDRTRDYYIVKQSTLPYTTLDICLSYAVGFCRSRYGIIGVKIWFYFN